MDEIQSLLSVKGIKALQASTLYGSGLVDYGKGHRKSKFQEYYDSFLKYALKLDEYEYWLSEMGERNISLTAFRVYRKSCNSFEL